MLECQSVPAVYRDVVVAQADETTGETFSLDEPNYLAAYTAGKKVTTDKQTLNFTFKTYETATLNWDTPVLLVYTSDDGIYDSKNTNYKHYANVRSDCWVDAEGTTETDASKNITINKTYPSDWNEWLKACKEEGKATVEYQKDSSNKVTIKYTVVAGDYTISDLSIDNNTITVEENSSKSYGIYITGVNKSEISSNTLTDYSSAKDGINGINICASKKNVIKID